MSADSSGKVSMEPAGPKCLRFSLQGSGKAATLTTASGMCLDTAPPPPPTPPPPPPPPPPYVGVTCKDPKFMHAKYCDKSLPVPERVAAIVNNMTIWEKIAMTDNGAPYPPRPVPRPAGTAFSRPISRLDCPCRGQATPASVGLGSEGCLLVKACTA